ncbi:MAG: hypothetical protein QM723_34045 [Myxococcaceae bacterium]
MRHLPIVFGVVLLQTVPAYAERVSGHVHVGGLDAKGHVRVLVRAKLDGQACPSKPAQLSKLLEAGPKVLAEGDTNAKGEFSLEYAAEPGAELEIRVPKHRTYRFAVQPDAHRDQPPTYHGYNVDKPSRPEVVKVREHDTWAPLKGAQLRFRPDDTGPLQTARTAADGTAKLDGEACVLVSAEGHAPAVLTGGEVALRRTDHLELSVRRGNAPAEAHLVLTAEGAETVELDTDGGRAAADVVKLPAMIAAAGDGGFARVSANHAGAFNLDLRPRATAVLVGRVEKDEQVKVTLGDLTVTLDGSKQAAPVRQELEVPEGILRLSVKWVNGPSQRPSVVRWVDAHGRFEVPIDLERPMVHGILTGPDGGRVDAQLHLDSVVPVRASLTMGGWSPLIRFVATGISRDGGFELAALDPGDYLLTAWSPSVGIARQAVTVPGPPLKLTLTPGATLQVDAPGGLRLEEFGEPAELSGWPPILERDGRGGSITVEHLWGRFQIHGVPDAGVVTLDDAGVHFSPPLPKREARPITGTVTSPRPLPPKTYVCGALGNIGHCTDVVDGGFTLATEPGARYRVTVSHKEWTSAPVYARSGETLTLAAFPWKPKKVKVADTTGKPVAVSEPFGSKGNPVSLPNAGRERFNAPGYIPIEVDTETVGDTVTLSPLPLKGVLKNGRGPVAGATVVALCRDKTDGIDIPIHWEANVSLAERTYWTWWPDGYECISGEALTAEDGTFELQSLSAAVSGFEVRWGRKVTRLEYRPGAPLELTLP